MVRPGPQRAGAHRPRPQSTAAREAWQSVYDLFFCDQFHDRMHNVCEALGLTPGLMKALVTIQPGEAKPMKQLSERWRCDASYVTSIVDGLEERGIVERQSHPTDRRVKTVALTPEGTQLRDELLDRLHEPPAALRSLSPVQLRALRDLLGKVVAGMVESGESALSG